MRVVLIISVIWIASCLPGFEPSATVFSCHGDEDCVPGWRCVDPGTGPVCALPIDGGGEVGGDDGSAAETTGDDVGTPDADASDVGGDVEVADAIGSGDTEADDATNPSDTVDESDGVVDGDPLVVDTGITFAPDGDELVQVGGTGKHYFVATEVMTFAAASAFCAARTTGGLTWSLARLQELRSLSRCCKTRPDAANRCVEVDACFYEAACAMVSECRGCGAPPTGDACWWDPTFTAPCGAFWAGPGGTCGIAFDFTSSEIVTLDGEASAAVMCTANAR